MGQKNESNGVRRILAHKVAVEVPGLEEMSAGQQTKVNGGCNEIIYQGRYGYLIRTCDAAGGDIQRIMV